MTSEELLNLRYELFAYVEKLNKKREQLKYFANRVKYAESLPWYSVIRQPRLASESRNMYNIVLEQYNKERQIYEEKLKAYNEQVKALNALHGTHSEVEPVATSTPVEAESPAVKAVTVEVPATKGTIQEVVSNPKPKLAPTVVISDDNIGELDDNLELNDVLIDDALELNDTPVVGVGDARVSYNGTVYRMPKEMASTVGLIQQSGGTGTLHKRVKYQGEDGSKALIRKGNWRKNQYKITEKDGSSYTTDNLQKFLQHLAAIEETAES